jgi:hypothetical protein
VKYRLPPARPMSYTCTTFGWSSRAAMRASVMNIVTTSRSVAYAGKDPLHDHELLEALDLGVLGGRQVELAHPPDRQQLQ